MAENPATADSRVAADLTEAAALIRSATSLALACHVSPDGDALGSMLGLFHLCRSQGVEVIASWPSPVEVAPHYQFLPGLELATKADDFPSSPEVMITFDCGSVGRLGGLSGSAERAENLVVLDHHVSNDRYGSVNVIDTEAAATAVVVRRLAAELGWPLNRDAAICLYAGLVTDTGRFQYSNTTPEVFALAEELAGFDLPIAEMSRSLFEEHRFAYLQLVAACLARAELDHELKMVATWITEADLALYGVDVEETEGLIDLVRRSSEAEVSCVLKETPEGVRVSLRSLSQIDVAAIAGSMGGGGHRYAAGFCAAPGANVHNVLDEIRAAVAAAGASL